jgi:putative FmdB family regulatory protein
MPIYEYACPTCGEFEQMRKITEPVLTVCPKGHAGIERKISAAGFILKGSGWYLTDYARKGTNGAGASNGSGAGGKSGKAEKAEKAEKAGTSSKGPDASKATAAAGDA